MDSPVTGAVDYRPLELERIGSKLYAHGTTTSLKFPVSGVS